MVEERRVIFLRGDCESKNWRRASEVAENEGGGRAEHITVKDGDATSDDVWM